MTATLWYFHDPMCSWCYAYRPVVKELFANLPDGVARKNVVGGLAPDSDVPMPQEQQQAIAGYWRKIEAMLGTTFNYDFWNRCKPRRSTYPACRAVLAADEQGQAEAMTAAIQDAYYLQARNPSDNSTLIELAGEMQLDVAQFTADLQSDAIEERLREQVALARRSPISGFPSLVLEYSGEMMPIGVDYRDSSTTLAEIRARMG